MRIFYLFICLTSTVYSHGYDIIFDLHGVLMYTEKHLCVSYIGLSSLLHYGSSNKLNNLTHDFFSFLDDIKPLTEPYPAWYNENIQLPQIMHDWLKGFLRSGDIQLLIQEHATKYYDNNNNDTKKLMLKIADLMFNPALLAHTMTLSTEAIALIRLYASLGHRIYLISNLDTETYVYLQKKYPDFWALFDGIIISGVVGYAKPDPHIYQQALQQFMINPNNAIYIDDVRQNVEAAITVGLHGIACKQYQYGLNTIPYIPYLHDVISFWINAQNQHQRALQMQKNI